MKAISYKTLTLALAVGIISTSCLSSSSGERFKGLQGNNALCRIVLLKRICERISTKTLDELDNCFNGGCDPTDKENWETLLNELDNCFVDGGCDPTDKENWKTAVNKFEDLSAQLENELNDFEKSITEIDEYISNPSSAIRQLIAMQADLADEVLQGFLSQNFGHVTNKHELKAELEQKGIVIYGDELTHDDYVQTAIVTSASITSSNPTLLANHFRQLGEDQLIHIRKNAEDALEKAPEVLTERYGSEIDKFDSDIIDLDALTLGTALATYIAGGEIPPLLEVSGEIDLSKFEVKFGILSYNRAERFFGDKIPTPNTHQPYILITLPELSIEVDKTLEANTLNYDAETGEKWSSISLGENEIRTSSPILEPEFYLLTYGDLRNAFENDHDAARNHWLTYGVGEGRRSSPAFDVQYYLGQYTDLQQEFGSNNYVAAMEHWLTHGIEEGRRSSIIFDVKYYLNKYPDLQQAFGSANYSAAVDHWLNHGVSEGRQGSSEFDPRFYLSNNPDVADVYGENNYMGAIAHYLEFGRNEGRGGTP